MKKPPSMTKVEEGVQKQVKDLYPIPDKSPILYERPTGKELTPREQAVLVLLGKYPGLTSEEVAKAMGFTSQNRVLQQRLCPTGLVIQKHITIIKDGKRITSVGYYLSPKRNTTPRE